MKITDLNLKSFNGVNKIEPDGTIETFYIINFANYIDVRYNENTGIVESLRVNRDNVPLDNPEIIEQLNAALEAERQRQQKQEKAEDKPKITIHDLTPVALSGIRKINGDIIETFNIFDIGTTISVKYNTKSGEVFFIKVNGHKIQIDNPEVITQFNEILETLSPSDNKKHL